ncbi:MAG: cobyrinate a,c-diamide synthase, partial [Gammaproteobacteria bacterium]|nr:cobyrinate a,c-diamide synthase [Gammaproteobacteria bacterium]
LYAQTLSTSATLSSIRNFIETSQPVLAECGGMMILGKALIDHAGHHWPMANALPIISRMQDRLAGLGYRESETGARGHEFHHSVREQDENIAGAFNVSRGDKGLHYKKLRASYIHWYFPSAPEEAASWFGAEADINKEAAA